MKLKYLMVDEKGNVGPSIPVVQGESKLINVFWYDAVTGAPYLPTSISALVVKVMAEINLPSIQKTLAASQVVLLECAALNDAYIGFQFPLLDTDTAGMAPNNSGLPTSFFITDSSGDVSEGDIADSFSVEQPLVTT